jgi:hypothetical protein
MSIQGGCASEVQQTFSSCTWQSAHNCDVCARSMHAPWRDNIHTLDIDIRAADGLLLLVCCDTSKAHDQLHAQAPWPDGSGTHVVYSDLAVTRVQVADLT